MIVDTSILLSIFLDEDSRVWCEENLSSWSKLSMSTVNLTEFIICITDRNQMKSQAIIKEVITSGINFIAPSVSQSYQAGLARSQFPLNLGDCFAYALAKATGEPLLYQGADFSRTDIEAAEY
jgi:ribonuclease VapC